jgi:hypothetical protein
MGDGHYVNGIYQFIPGTGEHICTGESIKVAFKVLFSVFNLKSFQHLPEQSIFFYSIRESVMHRNKLVNFCFLSLMSNEENKESK